MSKISSSPSDHLEVDDIEEQLGRLGSYGNIPEIPSANSLRSVFFVAPAAVGDGDGSSAGNALAGTATVVSANATANVRDVFVFLQGSYDPNTSTEGFALSVAGVKCFGLGGSLTQVANSNATAVVIFFVTAANCEIAGFYISEATNTVEGIVDQGSSAQATYYHHNILVSGMENGMRLNGVGHVIVEFNIFINMTNDGIECTGSTQYCRIFDNQFYAVGDNAMNLNGDAVDFNFVYDNKINGGAGTTDVGIAVTLGDQNEIVNNWIGQCTNHITDTGTANYFDNWVDEYSTTFTFTNAMAVAKQTLVSAYDCARPGPIYVKIDISTLHDNGEGGVSTWRLEESGGGDVYGLDTFNEGVDEVFPVIKDVPVKSGADAFDVTGQLGVAATVDRIVTIYIYERG